MRNLLLTMALMLATTSYAETEQNNLSFGLEMGVDNYFIAPTAQYKLNNNIRLSASAGLFLAEESGAFYYDTGVFYYPFGQGFRTSLNYGTHTLYEKTETKASTLDFGDSASSSSTSSDSFPTFEGVSLGLGWDWADSNGGWQMDMMYILTSSADDASELEDTSSETTVSNSFSTTTTSQTSSASAQGPDGSGSLWLKLGYRF